jgi:hypothetical protein
MTDDLSRATRPDDHSNDDAAFVFDPDGYPYRGGVSPSSILTILTDHEEPTQCR